MASDVSTRSSQDAFADKDVKFFAAWKQRRESMQQTQGSSNSDQPQAPRRRSTLRGLSTSLQGFLGLRRMTLRTSVSQEKPKIRMENTYKMTPDDDTAFSVSKVKEASMKVLEDYLQDKTYNHADCSEMACIISQRIKNAVKELNFPRYKIICNVVMGEARGQGLEAASRCIWDAKTDRFACVTYQNKSLFATVLVHGVYFE